MAEPFVVDDFEPAYLEVWRRGELGARVEAAIAELENCRACPRDCAVNRVAGKTRVCHTGRHAIVASAFAHFGEERCLSGNRGSGTIFFSLCNLRCQFCQNWDISQKKSGREMTADEIAEVMLALQAQGCHNINFVTPEHVAPQVVEAIAAAVLRGLKIPIVYNTSAYDSIRSLRLLDGLVDIYMPDFKFWSGESSFRFALARDYPERAREAITEMYRQVGSLVVDRDGIGKRGLLVRHLVMPGLVSETVAICDWLASRVSRDTWVNVMGQYRPAYRVGTPGRDGAMRYAEIARRPSKEEMRLAYEAAMLSGLWRLDDRAVTLGR